MSENVHYLIDIQDLTLVGRVDAKNKQDIQVIIFNFKIESKCAEKIYGFIFFS